MRLSLAISLLGASPAHADCALYDWPTMEGVAIQSTSCVTGYVPMDVTFDVHVRTSQTFGVTLAGKTVIVSTGPATCNGKPAAPVETDAHSRVDQIVNTAARCVAHRGLDLDHPVVHVQFAHWEQSGPNESTLIRETRITVEIEPLAPIQVGTSSPRAPVRVAVDVSKPIWSCAITG